MSLDWLWFAVILKIPLVALVLVVWWAIRQEPDDAASQDDDGGIRRPDDRERPLRPFPRHPRRGPHGDPPPSAPSRIRTVRARARSLGH
jgi:hypothetical protein